jgi:hypothetical protein
MAAAQPAATAQPVVAVATAPAPDIEAEIDAEEALDELDAEPPPALLSPRQRRRLEAYSGEGFKLLSARLTATRELLERTPDERYAIELFVTENTEPARMERFLIRARDLVPLDELYVIPMSGSQRLRVVYGEFDNAEQALRAGRRLPPKYQQAFRTSARSFADLRKQM